MTSWANNNRIPLKKIEPTIQAYISSSEDYTTSTLAFLYGFLYCQRTAEPFYIHDTHGHFQPMLKNSPILHYLKETPSSGTNLALNPSQMAPVINAMNQNTMKRTVNSIFQYNGETEFKIDTLLSNFGLNRQSFDVGIVLDISGCVPQVVSSLKTFQKRTGKKTLKIFITTQDMNLLREFAQKGDSSWNYVSMMRDGPLPPFKAPAELKLMRQIETVFVRYSNPLGKLLYLTSENAVISFDGQMWKAMS